MDSLHPWPKVRDEDKWLIDTMEELFATSDQTAEALRERAAYCRARAEATDSPGERDASLALATRYEQAALSRSQAR